MASIIVGIIVFGIIAAIIFNIYKNKKNGGSSCGGGCSGCGGSCH